MSDHVEERHATSLGLSETDPKAVRFEDLFDLRKRSRKDGGGEKPAKERAKVRLPEPP